MKTHANLLIVFLLLAPAVIADVLPEKQSSEQRHQGAQHDLAMEEWKIVTYESLAPYEAELRERRSQIQALRTNPENYPQRDFDMSTVNLDGPISELVEAINHIEGDSAVSWKDRIERIGKLDEILEQIGKPDDLARHVLKQSIEDAKARILFGFKRAKPKTKPKPNRSEQVASREPIEPTFGTPGGSPFQRIDPTVVPDGDVTMIEVTQHGRDVWVEVSSGGGGGSKTIEKIPVGKD